jgi:hypothetical protein
MAPAGLDAKLQGIVNNRLLTLQLDTLVNVEPQVTQRLLGQLDKAAVEVRKSLNLDVLTAFQENRLKDQAAWLQSTRDAIQAKLDAAVAPVSKDLAGIAQDHAAAVGEIISFGGAVGAMSTTGIGASKALAIASMPADGAMLQDYMHWLGQKYFSRVVDEVGQSVIQGETYREMVGRIGNAARGTLARSDCITMARTLTQQVTAEADKMVYAQNKDLIEGVAWLSTLDNRTCADCAVLDGMEWFYDPKEGMRGMESLPGLPLHRRCRCRTVPIVRSWSDLFGSEAAALDASNSEELRPYSIRDTYKTGPNQGQPYQVGTGGGKILEAGQTTAKTAEGWIKEHPEVADQILGKNRAELLLSGKMNLNDMLDQAALRQGTVRMMPLKVLQGGAE